MNISKDDYNELLSELVNECSLEDIEQDEVTVKMLAEELHSTERHAHQILSTKEQEGKLTSRFVRSSEGHRVKAYRKVKK